MTWGAVAAAGASLVGGMMASDAQSSAASSAAGAQTYNAELAVAEQRRQFDALRELLAPYNAVGTPALEGQKNLIGLNGTGQQSDAISAIANGPEMAALMKQGENAILSNASATGNLRGGNTQAALATFRPQLLAQLIQQKYANLGGLTTLGQNSAVGVGNAGMASANSVSQLFNQIGASQSGAAMAQGRNDASLISGISGTLGTLAGKYFGGTSPPTISLPGIMYGNGY